MSLLDTHLEQIELCSQTILDLPFPQPKLFTNALLHTTDITALIRDTESHERALFTLVPPSSLSASLSSSNPNAQSPTSDPTRRSTVFDVNDAGLGSASTFRAPRRNKAIAAVLGGDLADKIQRERAADASASGRRRTGAGANEGLDIELLLKGAEKLCAVYPMPGAASRIASVRARYSKARASIAHYESLVASQSAQLRSMNRSSASFDVDVDDAAEAEDDTFQDVSAASLRRTEQQGLSFEDLEREEESIRELERRKRTLEDRVSGMEKDLGGILR